MATFAKRNGRITATVRINPHPSQSKTFGTLRDAKLWAKEIEVKLSSETQGDYSHITLQIALERYRDEIIPSHRGADRDINRINRIMRGELPMQLPLKSITKYHILEWRDDRIKTLKGSSVNRDMSMMSAFFNLCVKEWGYIKSNPIAEVSRPANPPHRERIITQIEIDALLQQLQHDDAAKPVTIGRQVAVIFLLALETGMRAGEICGLTWDRVFLEQKKVYLHITKNGRPREVPLSKRAIELLQQMQQVNDTKVFELETSTLDAYFRKARKLAGLDGFTFHDARHTAATRIVKRGKIDVLSLCKIFGWQDPKKALLYYNPDVTDIADRLDGTS